MFVLVAHIMVVTGPKNLCDLGNNGRFRGLIEVRL